MVIGSQALLASCPNAPDALLRSMEVDCYPLDDPAKADLIDGSIGELSPFQYHWFAMAAVPYRFHQPRVCPPVTSSIFTSDRGQDSTLNCTGAPCLTPALADSATVGTPGKAASAGGVIVT